MLMYARLQLLKALWLIIARKAKTFYSDPEEMLDVMQNQKSK